MSETPTTVEPTEPAEDVHKGSPLREKIAAVVVRCDFPEEAQKGITMLSTSQLRDLQTLFKLYTRLPERSVLPLPTKSKVDCMKLADWERMWRDIKPRSWCRKMPIPHLSSIFVDWFIDSDEASASFVEWVALMAQVASRLKLASSKVEASGDENSRVSRDSTGDRVIHQGVGFNAESFTEVPPLLIVLDNIATSQYAMGSSVAKSAFHRQAERRGMEFQLVKFKSWVIPRPKEPVSKKTPPPRSISAYGQLAREQSKGMAQSGDKTESQPKDGIGRPQRSKVNVNVSINVTVNQSKVGQSCDWSRSIA